MIAATNRDLAGMVRTGKFREDLYYRLNVFPIVTPPLRARLEDIPLLVWAFVRELAPAQGKTFEQIPRRTMEALQRHTWPGNVRELRNVIERAIILSPARSSRRAAHGSSGSREHRPDDPGGHRALSITAVLDEVRWRIRGDGGAAQTLGLKPSTLESRISKLGIKR